MAKVQFKLPDAFMDQIANMGNTVDAAIPKVLEAGGEVVLDKMRSALGAAIGKNNKYENRSTGELAGSLGLSPAKMNRDGNYDVKVGFSEGRSGVSNAMLANVLEYGKHGQPPRPILKPAKAASRKPCVEAMEAAMKKEMGIT